MVVPEALAMSPNPETEVGVSSSLPTRSLYQGRLRCISLAYDAARSISLHQSLHSNAQQRRTKADGTFRTPSDEVNGQSAIIHLEAM